MLVKDYDQTTIREVRALAYGYVAGSAMQEAPVSRVAEGPAQRYAGPLEDQPGDMVSGGALRL